MSTTAAPRAGTEAPAGGVAAVAVRGRKAHPSRWWLGVAAAALLAWVAFTWPLALHLDHFWTMKGNQAVHDQPNFVSRPGAMASGDHMQNVFIQSVVIDNVRELRNPYLDLREGVVGLAALRTTSLDLPWTPLVALLWPLIGLVPAYNLTLLLASVATALAAFGWLRRQLRWPLVAAAGALAYACMPHRMFQLTSHFNAVLWWAFPAVLWAFDVMVERHRGGRRWWGPAGGLVAVVLTVAASGEYHLSLYVTALLVFVALWSLWSARATRRPLPLRPAVVAVVAVVVGASYSVLTFRYAFHGAVSGENGDYEQVVLYAPESLLALVRKSFGTQGEGLVYVGAALALLAAAGLALAVTRRRPATLAYAVLAVPLLMLTYGPRADIGPIRLYRFLFDHLPFLSMQRVPERLMVVTALVLVLLAATAVEELGRRWLERMDYARATAPANPAAAGLGGDGAATGLADDGQAALSSGDAVAAGLAGDGTASGPPGDGAVAVPAATRANRPATTVAVGEEARERPAAGVDGPRSGAGAAGERGGGDAVGGPGKPHGAGAEADGEDAGEAARRAQEQPAWLRRVVTAPPASATEVAAPPRPAPRRGVEALAGRWPRLWSLLAWWDRSSVTRPSRVAAGALVLVTLLLLADYRVSDNRLQPDLAHNKVVTTLRKAGDDAGPVLGLPALKPTVTWNSATTYLAAQSRRRTLNAYNQTPARWLEDRMDRLAGLNRGLVEPDALTVLRITGTRQVVVVDEPRVFAPGQWQEVVDRLVASGAFRLVVTDGPLALLEVTGAQRPSSGGNRPNSGFDPVTQV